MSEFASTEVGIFNSLKRFGGSTTRDQPVMLEFRRGSGRSGAADELDVVGKSSERAPSEA